MEEKIPKYGKYVWDDSVKAIQQQYSAEHKAGNYHNDDLEILLNKMTHMCTSDLEKMTRKLGECIKN